MHDPRQQESIERNINAYVKAWDVKRIAYLKLAGTYPADPTGVFKTRP